VWINIEKPEDYDELLDVGLPDDEDFEKVYGIADVVAELKANMRSRVRKLLVELSYVDKDYRSTFYHFYAKKGRQYRANCVRIHFFGATVNFDAGKLALSGPTINDKPSHDYFGFITLRPTYQLTIGRSVIRPDAVEHTTGLALRSQYRWHLLGYDLVAEGFPWMQQHSDISVCAHVACWSILRYYSDHLRKYRELLTHDITRLAQVFDPGGLIPSFGLHVEHAERIFCEAGTYPLVVSAPDPAPPGSPERKTFLRQLFAYLDSGFPLYVVLKDAPYQHAVAAIGYRWNNVPSLPGVGIAYAAEMFESLIIIDDNHLPYIDLRTAPFGKQTYCLDDIVAFIVPLPDKIFLPAEAIDNLVANLINDFPLIEFPDQDDVVLRYFVTTTALLREQMRKFDSQFDPELINEIMQLPMTQFVWIMEFSTKAEWLAHQVSVRAIIDATAGVYDNDVLWAIYDHKKAFLFDRNLGTDSRTLDFHRPAGTSYGRMVTNLDPIQV